MLKAVYVHNTVDKNLKISCNNLNFQLHFRSLSSYWQTRTHRCGHIVADTNVSPFARARNICCGHKFCVRDTKIFLILLQKHLVSATNVSKFARARKHHEQQCVRNNVSSFASTFRTGTSGYTAFLISRLQVVGF